NPGAVVNELRALMDASQAPKDDRWRARVGLIGAAVDSAMAKCSKQPEPETPPPIATLTLVHQKFREWLGDDYDIDIIDAVLAAAAAERLTGDPLWLLVISGPGNAKTETVQALAGAGAHIISTISSEGALLSASSEKPKGKSKSKRAINAT